MASFLPLLEFRQASNCFDPKSVRSEAVLIPGQFLRELAASTWSLGALSRWVALATLLERLQEEDMTKSRGRWRRVLLSAAFLATHSWLQTHDRSYF